MIQATWECPRVQELLGQTGLWIFDGNKTAWSVQQGRSFNEVVDMDVQRGREARPANPNLHRIQVRQSTKINLYALQAYINGKASFDKAVLESISMQYQLPFQDGQC